MIVDTYHSILSINEVNALVARVEGICTNIPSRRQLRHVPTDEIIAYILRTSPSVLQTTLHMHSEALRACLTAAPQAAPMTRCMGCVSILRAKSARVANDQVIGIQRASIKSAAVSKLQKGMPSVFSPRQIGEEPPHRFLADAFESRLTADDKTYFDSQDDKQKLRSVRQMLKQFHMTEFLLLVEFTEVIVPAIYGSYAPLRQTILLQLFNSVGLQEHSWS